MKEHYKRTKKIGQVMIYRCDHPLYFACTLFKSEDLGLAVIQQRFNKETKHTWWGPIDPWIASDILESLDLEKIIKEKGGLDKNGLYPTITIRQAMYALKLKPLPKDIWETRFF